MKQKTPKERPAIKPQPWYQERVLSSSADILISGAAAWVGKTFALLMESTRYLHVPWFGARWFRRTAPQITNQWGLWDTAQEIFPSVWGRARESTLEWIFPSGTRVKFSHLEYEKNIYDHQGAQYPLELFDELTHFTKKQFLYLLSRNRSTCGVRPYVRATCNPDPDSWVAELVEPWIDKNTGFPIKEMEGVIKYMVVDGNNFIFWDTADEVIEKCPHLFGIIDKSIDLRDIIKTITFISGSIYENKKLLEVDPSYLWNLLSQTPEERARLLEGNWKIRTDGLSLFHHQKIADLFSNSIEESNDDIFYITCDVARFGRDLFVAKVWKGWSVKQINIMTKSRTTEGTLMLEWLRASYHIPKSHVAVDQDGIWGWVLDESLDQEWGMYIGFSWGSSALEDPTTKVKEAYANLKTQCAYRMAERVNSGKVAVNEPIIYVDGELSSEVFIDGKLVDVRKLISEDLRSFKKKNQDREWKKQMIPKEEQKNILKRSPDFGDTFIMREVFEFTERQHNEEITII